jgi:cholesterol oxidase
LNAADFDAIVIGSGFGGSVVTDRLAEAGMRVCLLERGRAYPPGSFPRSPLEVSRSFWDPSAGHYGMYNVWSFDKLGALVCSGLGGGSLIYANILIRKDPETFVRDEHESWPITYG